MISVRCKKYQYTIIPDLKDRNYFSSAAKTFIEEIDLADYLIKDGLGRFGYSVQRIDEDNSYYIEAGSCELKLSNTLTGWGTSYGSDETLLSDFFELQNFAEAFLFVVEIFETDRTDEALFSGVIRRDAISFFDRSTEVMTMTAVSFDKEFADYFQHEELIEWNFPVVNMGTEFAGITGQLYTTLDWGIRNNFTNVSFIFDQAGQSGHFVYDYRMAWRAYLYAPIPTALYAFSNTLVQQSGYENFYLDKLDKYTWFNSMCLSMGWKWYFKAGLMYIDKLSGNDEVNQIDYNDEFIGHGYAVKSNNAIRNVLIDSGEFYGIESEVIQTAPNAMNLIFSHLTPGIGANYYYLGGQQYKSYNGSVNPNSNSSVPFKNLTLQVIGINQWGYNRNFGNNFSDTRIKISHEQNQEDRIKLKYLDNVLPFWYVDTNTSIETYDLTSTIILKPYINSPTHTAHLDITQARTTNNQFYGNGMAYNAAQDAGDNAIYMRGHPGHSLLFLNDALKYMNYDQYADTQEFMENMKMLTGGADKLEMDIQVHGIVTGIGEKFTIDNYPYSDLSNFTFICENVEIDLLKNSTNLKLVSL